MCKHTLRGSRLYSTSVGVSETLVSTSTQLFPNCGSLGKLSNFSELQCSHLYKGRNHDNKSCYNAWEPQSKPKVRECVGSLEL